jgi:putative ABC transport system substrate-binding protein
VADPVGVGLVTSLARPGSNVTGTSTLQGSVVAKQFDLMREVVSDLSGIAVIWNPANATFQRLALEEAHAAARTAGLPLQVLAAGTPEEIAAAYDTIRKTRTRAVLILADPAFTIHRGVLMEIASRDRLATVCGNRDHAAAGCLMSYGPSYFRAGKHAAIYVERILKGAKPADLPVEQPTQFELVINLKTANALNLTIPPSLLARADEVIE